MSNVSLLIIPESGAPGSRDPF